MKRFAGRANHLLRISIPDMPEDEWDAYADPRDTPDDPDDWRSESDED